VSRLLGRAALVVLASVAGVSLSACQLTPYAAIVGGQVIPQRALFRELSAIRDNALLLNSLQASQLEVLNPRARGNSSFDQSFVSQVLTRAIFLSIIHREVARRGLRVTPQDIDAAAPVVDAQLGRDPQGRDIFAGFPSWYRLVQQRRTAEIDVLTQALSGQKIDAPAIAAYYNGHQSEFVENCVSQILVASRAEADSVSARLAAGEDFAALARELSQDQASAARGGDMGCAGAGTFFPEVEQTVKTMAVGQISTAVMTQAGFDVIKLNDRRLRPLSEVSAEIRATLENEAGGGLSAFLAVAASRVHVVVNPAYGRWLADPSGVYRVVPPPPPGPAAGAPASGPAPSP